MTITSKLSATLAALALAASLAIPTSSANAGGKGWGIGAAIVGGAIVGAAVANSYSYAQPVYVDGYRRCRFVRHYDDAGFYLGTAKVCRYY